MNNEQIITNEDIAIMRDGSEAAHWRIIEKIQQRGFEDTLKDLNLPSDLNSEWRNIHVGTEEKLGSIIRNWNKKEGAADYEIPFVLKHWEPNIGINPIKEAERKLTKEEIYQKVVDRFSYYKNWSKDFEYLYKSIRSGMEGGSFMYGGSISVGGYLGSSRIGSDKILVSWGSGKHFIFTVRQVLQDVLADNRNRQLSLF